MKKILLCISILLISFVSPVMAKENKLYFTESNNQLYYESKLFDENIFMHYTDMIPGKTYTDELTIENGTKTTYNLYFKVLPKEQSDLAKELIDNLNMKITSDNQVLYDGKAISKETDGSMDLGKFEPSTKINLIFETELDKSYSNASNTNLSYIDWAFYAEYADDEQIDENESSDESNVTPNPNENDSKPIEIVEAPDTMKNTILPIIFGISIALILTGVGIMIYAKK